MFSIIENSQTAGFLKNIRLVVFDQAARNSVLLVTIKRAYSAFCVVMEGSFLGRFSEAEEHSYAAFLKGSAFLNGLEKRYLILKKSVSQAKAGKLLGFFVDSVSLKMPALFGTLNQVFWVALLVNSLILILSNNEEQSVSGWVLRFIMFIFSFTAIFFDVSWKKARDNSYFLRFLMGA